MSEIAEVIQDRLEEASKNKINSIVAIMVAVTATVMALCNVKDGNICQSMQQEQAHGIDAWSYYQAKSTKQMMVENTVDILKQQGKAENAALIQQYEDKIKKYDKEKADIKAEAEGHSKAYDDLNLFDDQFDMTEALLTISIAMFGITSLTQKKWLLYFASVVSAIGIILGLTAFMHISLHSDFVARILG